LLRYRLPFPVDCSTAKARLKKQAGGYILRFTATEAVAVEKQQHDQPGLQQRSPTENVQDPLVTSQQASHMQHGIDKDLALPLHGNSSSAAELTTTDNLKPPPSTSNGVHIASFSTAPTAAAGAAAVAGGMTFCDASTAGKGDEAAQVQEAASIDAAGLCDLLIANAWMGAKKTPAELKRKVR
jgi:hypothetical protein